MSIMEQIFESLKLKPFEPFQLSKMGDQLFRLNDNLLLERRTADGKWELEDFSLGLTNILNNFVEIIHLQSDPVSHNDAVWRYYVQPHSFFDDSYECGWQCSHCGHYADSLLPTEIFLDYEQKPELKYCPNCGAHMIELTESTQEETKNDTNGNIFDGA